LNPIAYRAENIFIHAANGVLLVLLAVQILNISWISALIGSLLFLVHPAQVESVVWIVERSNLLATFFILLAAQCWFLFLRKKSSSWAFSSIVLLILGLLTRETAVIFPGLAAIISFTLIYLGVRTCVLGKMAQTVFFGGTWGTNLLSAMRVGLFALQFLIFPFPQNVNHLLPDITEYHRAVFLWSGVMTLLLLTGTIIATIQRRRIGFCLIFLLLFWFPTSQIFPLATPFAERFLYASLIPIAWLIGLGLDHTKKYFLPLVCGVLVLISCYAWQTNQYIPVWQNDVTLWTHAKQLNPTNWQNWYHMAEGEKVMAWARTRVEGIEEQAGWRDRAEQDYLAALKCGFPADRGGIVFLNLAEINLQQGKFIEAEENARRGLALRPDLLGLWQNRKAQFPSKK